MKLRGAAELEEHVVDDIRAWVCFARALLTSTYLPVHTVYNVLYFVEFLLLLGRVVQEERRRHTE